MNQPADQTVQISHRRWFIQAVGVPIVVALIGLAGSAPTWLPIAVDVVRSRGDMPDFSGQWTARFREWCPKGPGCADASRWIINTEHWGVSQTGSRVSATVQSEGISFRTWLLAGRYRTPVLALTYVDPKPEVASVGAYVLRLGVDGDKFRGYWLGYDRDLETLVTCPLVLTRGQLTGEVVDSDAALKQWLQQPCVTPPSGGTGATKG